MAEKLQNFQKFEKYLQRRIKQNKTLPMKKEIYIYIFFIRKS